MSYYRYEQEHGELPEPIIYGGYGSGANAVQEVYSEPSGEPDERRGGHRNGMRCTVDGVAYPSLNRAAEAIGSTSSHLSKALRKGNGRCVVRGREVERASQR